MKKRTNIIILAGLVCVYFGSQWIPLGPLFFWPVELLVAFLHEFGHASMALLTGGRVEALEVNPDGSGVTTTLGGSMLMITAGGYIGSCVFSNLLVRASLTSGARVWCFVLALIQIFSAFMWYSSETTTMILIVYSIGFIMLGTLPVVSRIVLQFIGVACVIHILQDFRVGPSSDLQQFRAEIGVFPVELWMWAWLAVAVLITITNVKLIIQHGSET